MLGTGAIVKRPRVIVDEFGNEVHRCAVGVLPAADLRPPADRRRRRRTLRDHHQAQT